MRILTHKFASYQAALNASNDADFRNFSLPIGEEDDAFQGGSFNGQYPPRQYLLI